ncbi:Scarecrow-like protein 14 [Camellia lanceoleosa]|uniref:Scarecrow-like protein 14 n=1 Tax=Camellia lanceoleosa TaxID=1840588 RepID=A0ACC0HSC4_9ERIC|nr:Scarecrow-like protein 14 [Camellia lanceoleosa]
MRNLLIQCMQSVANNDHQSARKLLRQIRWRSSPRVMGPKGWHYFANSLEARLVGTGSSENRALAAIITFLCNPNDYGTGCQSNKSSHYSFRAMSGIQWIPLFSVSQQDRWISQAASRNRLSTSGFPPAARVMTKQDVAAKYCDKFNVPFEYNGIAQKWETVNVEDLGIEKDELLVVNCLYHLMHILDETIMQHSPRDAVLNLILRINPDIFIHGIVNGNYNSPFFVSRFREALFHFSAFFDMLEANVPRENHERMVFERDIWGKEILNVIACEGLERTERPETYKHWQIRMLRAGFKQLPLNQEIIKQIRTRVKSKYHKDFFVDDASQWMLSGWKGRALFALSCWKPA